MFNRRLFSFAILQIQCIYFKSAVASNIIVPTPLEGKGTVYSMGFCLQTILADRYHNRRELGVVLLESPSCVEHGMNFLFQFSLFIGSYQVLRICEY